MDYLLQWQETRERNSMLLDALSIALTGKFTSEFEPLQRLIAADAKYPGIPESGRSAWQFGNDLATVIHGRDGAVPSNVMGQVVLYAPLSTGIMAIVDAILHLSQGPSGESQSSGLPKAPTRASSNKYSCARCGQSVFAITVVQNARTGNFEDVCHACAAAGRD